MSVKGYLWLSDDVVVANTDVYGRYFFIAIIGIIIVNYRDAIARIEGLWQSRYPGLLL